MEPISASSVPRSAFPWWGSYRSIGLVQTSARQALGNRPANALCAVGHDGNAAAKVEDRRHSHLAKHQTYVLT
jgi:hypothetical protein